MAPRFMDGNVAIFRTNTKLEIGDVAVVSLNGQDATIRVLKWHENGVFLVPYNTSYEPMFFTDEEAQTTDAVNIIGKVIELRGKFKF